MLGIVDLDYQRADRLQDALDQHGIASFVVNTVSDQGSASLIIAADSLIVAASLVGDVLSQRHHKLGHGAESDEQVDIVVPFIDFYGGPYQVVMRSSVGNWRPDWRLFRARLSLEAGASLTTTPAQNSEIKLAS